MTRVAIVGAGGMGGVHAAQYAKMPDVELGFYEIDEARAVAFSERAARKSEAEVIEWADVVDVCVPTDLHATWALRAIAAGRAVFLEKPLARTYEDGVRVVEAAERAGVPLMPGQVVRFFPEFAQGARLVRAGAVGVPAAARTRRGGGPPGAAWFMDFARSGGILLDLAIHDFDFLRWTLGEVERVTARTAAGGRYGLTTLKFADGAVGHVEATWMDPGGFRTAFEVAGPEGLVEFDSRSAAAVRTVTASGARTDNGLAGTDDPYYLELRGFLDSIGAGTEPPVTGREGLAALAIALAAVESASQDGRPTDVIRG